MTADEIAQALAGRRTGGGWIAHCPAHDDKNASLSLKEDNGRLLFHCHAGCEQTEVIKSLKARGLFAKANGHDHHEFAAPPKTKTPKLITQPSTVEAREAGKRLCSDWITKGYELANLHHYTDKTGKTLFWRIRLECPGRDKIIRPLFHDGKAWRLAAPEAGRDGRPLYNLQDLVARPDDPVYIVEGEKCADTLTGLGLLTTTSGGVSSANGTDWRILTGRRVILWPDNDGPGRKYETEVIKKLQGLAASISLIEVENLGLPEKGDVVDWLNDHSGATAKDVGALPLSEVHQPAPIRSTAVVVCMDSVKAEPVKWLWPGRFALGKVSMIAGDPGLGKSLLSLDLAARVSTGSRWPDGSACSPGNIMLISAEDDPSDTIRPRLDAAGANVSRIHILTGVMRPNLETGGQAEGSFELLDINPLEDAIARVGDVRLIVVDPISAFQGDADSHNNSEVRALLAPLAALAARYNLAIIAVSHLNKGQKEALYRVAGSLAYVAAARAVFAVAKDKDDPVRRLFLPVKNNLGNDEGGLAYRVEVFNGAPRVEWEATPIVADIGEMLGTSEFGAGSHTERREAGEWLMELLASGPMAAKEIKAQASDAGFSWRTIERAKAHSKVMAKKESFSGRWVWEAHDRQNTLQDRQDRQLSKHGGYGGLAGREAFETPPQEGILL